MQNCISYIKTKLSSHYSASEINSFIRIIFDAVCGYSLTDLILHKNNILSESVRKQIDQIVNRIDQNEPIQYILGKSNFCGMPFTVSPSVLIPRPETEELVELITRKHRDTNARIVDIGTGSGCIAISLAKNMPGTDVCGWDISENALRIARQNAHDLNVAVSFQQTDILHFTPEPKQKFDIIVSNPPYVCRNEQKEMEANVLDYEPHLALFVPDDDPLLFYRTIARIGQQLLTSGGFLYFEINRQFGQETEALLQENGYENIEIIKDISGNDRMVSARLKE